MWDISYIKPAYLNTVAVILYKKRQDNPFSLGCQIVLYVFTGLADWAAGCTLWLWFSDSVLVCAEARKKEKLGVLSCSWPRTWLSATMKGKWPKSLSRPYKASALMANAILYISTHNLRWHATHWKMYGMAWGRISRLWIIGGISIISDLTQYRLSIWCNRCLDYMVHQV